MMYCVCLDVRGAIKNFNKRQLTGMFHRADGSKLTADEARDHLLDQVAQGREVIPLGDCENFDYVKGCQGHAEVANATGATS